MIVTIEHVTRYHYASDAGYCVQSLRLTPASYDGHTVLDWQIAVEPGGQLTPARDGFGNVIHLATISGSHREIIVRASGSVAVENRNGVVLNLPETMPFRVYLRRTSLTMPDPAIVNLLAGTAELEPIPRLHALMNRIRDLVDYQPGMTHSLTTASEALARGAGVCQDHAHIFIAACRAAGIPARYVTGYLVVDEASPSEAPPSEAHHAWAEAWVDGLGWVGFDAANRICPTDTYVRMASALDAFFAAPVRGARRGSGVESLEVEVHVTAARDQQSQSQQ